MLGTNPTLLGTTPTMLGTNLLGTNPTLLRTGPGQGLLLHHITLEAIIASESVRSSPSSAPFPGGEHGWPA